jgi:RimJ/RimL family protein N-acetyltransferase
MAPPSPTEGPGSSGGEERTRLRPVTDDDLPFLLRLYADTRAEELAGVDWPEAQRVAFVRQQFEAQHAWYREQYVGASFDVVEVDGEPAGRLYVARWPAETRIVDISLLRQHRGRGIGTALLRDLLAEADEERRAVSIHVERFNPALRLYARLGFALREDKGIYLLLERPARASAAGR